MILRNDFPSLQLLPEPGACGACGRDRSMAGLLSCGFQFKRDRKPRSWLLDVARMIIVRSLASHLCSREVRHLCTAYCRAHARMALGSVGASAKTGSPQRLPEQGEQCAQVRVLGFLLRAFRRDQAWQGRCGSGSRRSKRSRRRRQRQRARIQGFVRLDSPCRKRPSRIGGKTRPRSES